MTGAHTPSVADVLTNGMTRWHGGDTAPTDWDGGPVLWDDGVISGAHKSSLGWQRGRFDNIVGYTRATSKEASHVMEGDGR